MVNLICGHNLSEKKNYKLHNPQTCKKYLIEVNFVRQKFRQSGSLFNLNLLNNNLILKHVFFNTQIMTVN